MFFLFLIQSKERERKEKTFVDSCFFSYNPCEIEMIKSSKLREEELKFEIYKSID